LNPILHSMFLDLRGLSEIEAEQVVFDKYVELYLDHGVPPRTMGVRKTHDGSDCLFTESRFGHAFFSKERYTKEKFDRLRGARVAWIGPVISGKIEGTECWLVPPKGITRQDLARHCNRLYLVRDESFVVWLEPGKINKWWFSTTYVAGRGDIRRYCNAGTLVWAQKTSRD